MNPIESNMDGIDTERPMIDTSHDETHSILMYITTTFRQFRFLQTKAS